MTKLKKKKIKNVSVGVNSFENVINGNDFIYLDPPYYLSGNMFRGIYPSRNRPINHNNFNHNFLAEILKSYKGKWMLSYNDCIEVKKLYEKFNFYFPSWQYTMGQGETRIGINRKKNSDSTHIKKSHEILITNY